MKKILMLISNGFEEVEALTAVDLLRRAGITVDMCSITGEKTLYGSHDIKIIADCLIEDIKNAEKAVSVYDGIVLPGGMPNSTNLRDDERVLSYIKAFAAAGKITAAICAAPIALERAGLLDGIEATSYPDCLDETRCLYCNDIKTVVSNNIVTSRGVGTAIDFALALIGKIDTSEKADTVAKAILYKK
ncbi:MAG: DJ-1/PfpI family protein [Clostridia bacterium]|nr:DJ-1/PfpI family protein [Clostridia bacterium]